MTISKHPNHGTTLEDVLREDGNLEAATAYAVKRVIAWQLEEEMAKRHLTKTAMAKLMDTSRKQLDRVLSPDDGNVTLETLQRAAKAVGRTIKLELA
ncbi:Fis family transcriptional regulator [Devosia sp.]|uniref:Fis family transcriptional regulator n=1 Tax=Devosia sp. TaxID=1871048 RepID=UPI003BAC7E3C